MPRAKAVRIVLSFPDREWARSARAMAIKKGMSLSAWITDLLRQELEKRWAKDMAKPGAAKKERP
jgi:hypothetical protein